MSGVFYVDTCGVVVLHMICGYLRLASSR